MNTTLTLRHLALAATAVLALGTAQAANFSKAVYDGAKTDVKATYQTERDACKPLTANAKDICVEQAKAHEKVALAQLEVNYSGSNKDEQKLSEARYEAAYAVAKEKCDDLAGNAKGVCVQEAKTARDKAKANLKLTKTVTASTETAIESHLKADYKLAREKCDALSGDPKDICVASAKARFNER